MKRLILWTLAALLFVFAAMSLYQTLRKPHLLGSKSDGTLLSMGSGASPIEITLIEDFQCRHCMSFSQKIVPKIERCYIRPGKARFVLVPVSFLPGSQAIANAMLEVYAQNPKKLFVYLEAVLAQYESGDMKKEELVHLARQMGGIHLGKLEEAIETRAHDEELKKNLAWAQEMMGPAFRTPALFINGEVASTFSFEAIEYQMDEMFKR